MFVGEMFAVGTTTKFRRPYVIDPLIPTRPQYGSAGAMYPADFSSSPVPNCQAATSYPSQSANTGQSQSYITTDSQSVSPGVEPNLGLLTRDIFLSFF
jgi:hypothetical protein